MCLHSFPTEFQLAEYVEEPAVRLAGRPRPRPTSKA